VLPDKFKHESFENGREKEEKKKKKKKKRYGYRRIPALSYFEHAMT